MCGACRGAFGCVQLCVRKRSSDDDAMDASVRRRRGRRARLSSKMSSSSAAVTISASMRGYLARKALAFLVPAAVRITSESSDAAIEAAPEDVAMTHAKMVRTTDFQPPPASRSRSLAAFAAQMPLC